MRLSIMNVRSFLLLGLLQVGVLGDQVLQTSGFTTCQDNSSITVNNVDIRYNNDNKTVTFNVAGSSATTMNVTAILNVTAYGISVYSNSFNPCDAATFVRQLCPVPAGSFSASGVQQIPAAYASLVPAIAFQIPDIAAQATLQLKTLNGGKNLACIKSEVSNGKTVSVAAVSYVAVGIAGAAVVMAGASALGAAVAAGGATGGGAGTMSPSFVEVFGWFQGIAMNGMMSVNYPPVYRSFSKNFAFSTGIISWTPMQTAIDNFRSKTGGNLTTDNVQYLQNATLVFADTSTGSDNASVVRRAILSALQNVQPRQITTSVNTTAPTNATTSSASQIQLRVSGITAFVEEVSVPQANTFMTVLLVVAIIIAAIAVGVLFFKLVLELWALFGSFPKALSGFRKHYWGTMARSIVQLILILYGIWTLYCIFQFTHGDSWAAKALAGVTLGLFTGVLAFFSFKIWQLARKFKEDEGDTSKLYEDKQVWIKYSLFYDAYKRNWWWTFVPAIVYMFAKGTVLAAADGHGLAQTIAQLVIEGIFLIFLVFCRPFERKSGNVINIFIQVVRALSVVCILVFVEELGIAQTTQTVTGVVLIAVQSVLTALLAILIAVNAIIICFKANPHRKRRKEAEKLNRDLDNLTPLDARNSLLTGPAKSSTFNTTSPGASSNLNNGPKPTIPSLNFTQGNTFNVPQTQAEKYKPYGYSNPRMPAALGPGNGNGNGNHIRGASREKLMGGAAPMAGMRRPSPPGYGERQPQIPNVTGYGGYRGVPY